MFNIGPLELMVLAIVGLVVLGPDRLPGMARDAARLIRSLRDMATGARQQLRDELGPEFADMDLRNLNPRTAVQRAVFGDDVPDFTKYDPRRLNPGAAVRDMILGGDEGAPDAGSGDDKPVSMTKSAPSSNGASSNGAARNVAAGNGVSSNGAASNGAPSNGARPRPRPKPGPRTSYDDDAT
jgi:sec-independent protein translocase protein TatB